MQYDMNHEVWQELEAFFQTRLLEQEKRFITQVLLEYMQANPEMTPEGLGRVTHQVVERCLAGRGR